MKRQTLACAAATLALALASTAAGAQGAQPDGRTALVGAWAGTTKAGTKVEYAVEAIRGDDTVAGAMCMRFSNGGMRGYPLSNALLEDEEHIVFVGRHRRYRYAFSVTDAQRRRAAMVETKVEPDRWRRTTKLREARETRCLDRFVYDASAPVESPEPTEQTPVLGAWSGAWADDRGWAGMVITSVSARGLATGRYCTRTQFTDSLTVWDMGPGQPFKGEVADDGGSVVLRVPWPNGSLARMTLTMTGVNEGELSVRETSRNTRAKTTVTPVQRGETDQGCLRRTTAAQPHERTGAQQQGRGAGG